MTDSMDPALAEYLSKTPPESEWIEKLARRYRGMTVEERLHQLSELLRWMDSIAGDRNPPRDRPLPLWSPDPVRNHAESR
ncbi:MAG: hypothetical protein HY292_07190 [Planctomycetes bacterium]|nr:hypothetical protein [Planctomycetota bacterium]